MTSSALARPLGSPLGRPFVDSQSHVFEDADALGQHLRQCRQRTGLRHATALWLDSAHQIIGPRFMTTVAGATLVLIALTWWA